MKKPTPLSVIDEPVTEIVFSGALRDGHWLYRHGVLFVADDLKDEAMRLWPECAINEARGRQTMKVLHMELE